MSQNDSHTYARQQAEMNASANHAFGYQQSAGGLAGIRPTPSMASIADDVARRLDHIRAEQEKLDKVMAEAVERKRVLDDEWVALQGCREAIAAASGPKAST